MSFSSSARNSDHSNLGGRGCVGFRFLSISAHHKPSERLGDCSKYDGKNERTKDKISSLLPTSVNYDLSFFRSPVRSIRGDQEFGHIVVCKRETERR